MKGGSPAWQPPLGSLQPRLGNSDPEDLFSDTERKQALQELESEESKESMPQKTENLGRIFFPYRIIFAVQKNMPFLLVVKKMPFFFGWKIAFFNGTVGPFDCFFFGGGFPSFFLRDVKRLKKRIFYGIIWHDCESAILG